MNITILSVGKIKDKAIYSKIEDFKKMLMGDCTLDIIELKDSTAKKEQEEMLEKIAGLSGTYVFVLSEEGKTFSSVEFSKEMNAISQNYKHIIFCIGGPDGFLKPISFGDKTMSLSKMTFTHEMAKLFLVEQIYRAFSIKNNKRYHRE